MQWSNLEYQIAHCIWWMLRLMPETGKIVTGGLDMLPRLNMAINLARHLNAPKPLLDQLIATRAAIQDGLDIRRNKAVHGVHFRVGDDEPLVEVHRGKGDRKAKPFPVSELASLGSELNKLSSALSSLLYGLIKPSEEHSGEDARNRL
jgi:hypothetical protein